MGLLAVGTVSSANAQISVGAVVGLNRSSISGDSPDKVSYSTRTGLVAGAVIEIPVAKSVHLVFQPGFVQRGVKLGYDVGNPEPVDSGSVALDYLSMPVLIKVLADNGWLYVTSGLDFGYLSSATLTEGSAETDVSAALSDWDVAVIFGVGGLIPIGRPSLTLEARYSQSLVNLPDATAGSSSLPARFRSSGFQFLAGVLLPLGGDR
jgi:hypothetical protein